MTTSLAALAAANGAHTSSTVLMSTSLNQNQTNSSCSNSNSYSTNNNNNVTSNSTSVIDINDTNYEIKTEFYTREGLWKLVQSCEYARQQQQNIQLNQSLSSNTNVQVLNNNQNMNSSTANNLNNQNYTTSTNTNSTSNDPVRIGVFKYSKKFIFKDLFLNKTKQSNNNKARNRNTKLNKRFYCDSCYAKLKEKQKFNLKKVTEYDDDDNDVIFTQYNKDSDENEDQSSSKNKNLNKNNKLKLRNVCKSCNIILNNDHLNNDSSDEDNGNYEDDDDDNDEDDDENESGTGDGDDDDEDDIEFDSQNQNERFKKENSNYLDLILFNYARDIYSYEFNSIKSKNDTKNLIDKKSYKTVMSTCFDINKTASISNTVALQLSKINNSTNLDYNSLNLNLSLSNLSLIVAAGFNKGEIHVFDVFKKDASVFYNNSKLVDKTKVTCIKWLPNSMSLFLVGYSSGNIYLYDVNNQTQSQVAPTYTKLCQNESFSVYINNNSSPTNPTIESQNNVSTNSLNKSLGQNPKKLILSNSNQPSNVAKNPLLKLTIGPSESNYSYGVNGVNDFEFSPCGNYLAVVSQDGYLRVFTFIYKNNQQMQLQLRCSMKSYFGGLLCVCWSSDSKYIATGGEDDLITVFSFVEMRVACRGRGHSSWINGCSFDPWTKLSNYSNNPFLNTPKTSSNDKDSEEQENESDLEEFHNKQQQLEKHLEQLELEKKNAKNNRITAPKKRTISTLSDYHCNSNFTNTTNTMFYRLASVGQDNQICFWDLTEDVLKEKTTHNSRSRMTSMIVNNSSQQTQYQHQLPQLIIQPNDLNPNAIDSNNYNINQNQNSNVSVKETKHHSAASSIVSTARSLFSSKHSSSGEKLQQQQQKYTSEQNSGDTDDSPTPKSSTLSGSFFKRHKRNSSLSNTSSQGLVGDNKSRNSYKQSPIVLYSYKTSNNSLSLNPNETNPNTATSDSSGVNSLNIKKINVSPISGYNSTNTNNSKAQLASQSNSNPFNLCPKLDEVPNIEPLICKRISTERLTSIVFKKDCFIVATQDGFIYTWARPKKHVNSSSSHQSSLLPQLSSESKINSTCL